MFIGEGSEMMKRFSFAAVFTVVLLAFTVACAPTVKVEAPTEPITINLNIKLDAEVRLKLEEKR